MIHRNPDSLEALPQVCRQRSVRNRTDASPIPIRSKRSRKHACSSLPASPPMSPPTGKPHDERRNKGPLEGVRLIELAGLGALPFGSLKLADMGAEIIRVDRLSDVPADRTPRPHSFWERGRRSIAVDLKQTDGVETVLRLVERADGLLESFRPGVAERLGLGPEIACARNPRLVYARLTGFGQTGPLAQTAGHSLNYEAITGFARAIGPRDGAPVPVLNVVGDFAGGGLQLAYGVVCALFEAQRSGRGQVVDVAMIDGVMSLVAPFYAMHASGMHTNHLGSNLFDGGAPFYAMYPTSDGRFVSIAAIEPRFFAELCAKIGLESARFPDHHDSKCWVELRHALESIFLTATRDDWCARFEGSDACFAPVLDFSEAARHPHNLARGAFLDFSPMPELRPSPRLSRTPGAPATSPAYPGADTRAVLADAGFSNAEIEVLIARAAVV